jgi:hypothetical protein
MEGRCAYPAPNSKASYRVASRRKAWLAQCATECVIMSVIRVVGSYAAAARATACIASRSIAVVTITCLLANVAVYSGTAFAQSTNEKPPAKPVATELTSEDLLRNIACLEERLRALEERKAEGTSPPARSDEVQKNPCGNAVARPWITTTTAEHLSLKVAPTVQAGTKEAMPPPSPPVEGISFGAYGEIKFGRIQNPDAGGQWQTGFDAARVVLSPTYAITKNIIFNTELEFEHGGIAVDADDKLAGSVDVEQLFIEFKVNEQFNWRAPGIDLIPIGYINEHHEPNQFYSVNRPELYLGLMPSTWRAPATRVYGLLGNGLSYALQVSQSIEDFGDSFDKRTDANILAAGPYVGGFSIDNALGLLRTPVGDFRQLDDTLAYAGRLDYQPPWQPGFAGSLSVYYSPNTTPRGAHVGDNGGLLGKSSLTMFDGEFRYRLPETGLELRGEYVRVDFGNPANLRANNDGDNSNNIGKTMYGYSGEIAYHFPLGTILESAWEAVPFYRYTFENFQTGGFAGTDANAPTGKGRMQFHTAGMAIVPSPKMIVKLTYQKVIDDDPAGANANYVLGAVGFSF